MQSGKPQFGYIYGVGLLGSASIYTLLNLMSEQGIDAYRVTSVLGYCLLPMVGVGALSVMVTLKYVIISLLARATLNANALYLQWVNGIYAIFALYHLVHVFSIRNICHRVEDVRPATSRCIPCWTFVRLLCPSQHLPCWIGYIQARWIKLLE